MSLEEEPDLSSMTKAELLEYAAAHGIGVKSSMLKADILEAINNG